MIKTAIIAVIAKAGINYQVNFRREAVSKEFNKKRQNAQTLVAVPCA
jgi:hypothetical protein